MSRTIHLSLSIRGALASGYSGLKNWRGAITVDGKTLQTVQEIQEFFFDQLAMGRELLPFGESDNFDYKTGCKGHSQPDNEAEALAGKT